MSARTRFRHRRDRRRRTGLILALSTVTLLAMTASLTPARLLIWNATASAPIGLYRRTGGPIVRGDLVLAWLPAGVRELAAERNYLPHNVPVVKRVAGVGGDTVCADDMTVFLNGAPVATRLPADKEGRPLPSWEGCKLLQSDDVFLLSTDAPASFDGRYFGSVGRRQIIGRLVSVWIK